MKKYMIITGTITYAIKGRDLLKKNGYKAKIERTAPVNQGYGCGYVIITEGNVTFAKEILQKSGVKILDIKEIS